MPAKALKSIEGKSLSWREAAIRSLKGIGHPATVDEIFKYMTENVIDHIPDTAKTPLNTIYAELHTHSRNSESGKNVFYSDGNGHWGLLEEGWNSPQAERVSETTGSEETVEALDTAGIAETAAAVEVQETVNTWSEPAETQSDTVPTLRRLCHEFIETNPHHFNQDLMNKIRKTIGNMSPAMDMRYDNIPDQMFDDAITRAKTDLSRTELAFLVHTFDRKTGAHHTLAYDAQTEL